MAHIRHHRPYRHDPYQGHVRRRGNGSIPDRRRHGGLDDRDAMAMAMGAGLDEALSGGGMSGRGMSGKGPKGYVRSDDRIREDVCDCLTDDPHLDAGSIEVRVEHGDVTLSGTVDSREARRHAEDLADRVRGVKDVHCSLRVRQRAVGPGGTF